MKHFDYDTKFTGMRFTFDIKEWRSEFPDLAKFHGHEGTIDCVEVGDGKTIEGSYWNVIMDDGTELSGISGYHLTKIIDL